MKHNRLIENLLKQFPGDAKVYFKLPTSSEIFSISHLSNEVEEDLYFFKSADEKDLITINGFLEDMKFSRYEEDEYKNDDLEVALCSLSKWDDGLGFNNLFAIVDAIQVDNKVILITTPYEEDKSNCFIKELRVISSNREQLSSFIEKINELKSSTEFNETFISLNI